MTELQILNAVKNNGESIGFTDLMNLGMSDTVWYPNADKQRICQLINAEILAGDAEAHGTIHFGKVGHLRLQELQQIEEDNAKQAAKEAKDRKSQFRHDWAIAIVSSLLGALLSEPLWSAIYFLLNLLKPLLN